MFQKNKNINPADASMDKLVLNQDYYINAQGLFVLTEFYLLKRGHCCESGCLHCPYRNKKSD